MKASGYAILYDVPDSEGTIYEEGCLDNVDLSSVKVTDGKNNPISTVEAESLSVEVDGKGLKFTTFLSNGLTYSRDVLENIRVGNTLGVEVFADTETVIRAGIKYVTRVVRLRGIIITSAANGKYSSIKLIDDSKGLSEMTDDEYASEREKLKLELELM